MSQKREDTGEVHRCDHTSTRMMQKLLLCYIMQMISIIMSVYMFAVFVLFVCSITEHANAERSQSIKDTLLEDHSPLPATIHLDRSCGLCGP